MDKQSSQIDHGYKLYAKGMIDRGQFKDMTGVEVKKRATRKKKTVITGPAVIYVGDQPPTQNTAGYVTRSVIIAGFELYYEVQEALSEEMDKKGVSLQGEGGGVKSENEIYPELYGFDPNKRNYQETYEAIVADQDAFIEKFGEGAFWSVTTTARYNALAMQYAPFTGSQYYANMATLNDLLNNQEAYAAQLGAEEYFRQLEAAFETAESYYDDKLGFSAASYQESREGEEAVSFRSLVETFPQYVGGFEYSEVNAIDVKNKNNDLPPQSFDMDAVAAKLTLPSWYEVPETWDIDSLIEAMCVSAYMDWSYYDAMSHGDGILPDSEVIRQGAATYYIQHPDTIAQYESVIEFAEMIPAAYQSQEAMELEVRLAREGASWEDLPTSERAYYAQQKIESFKPELIEMGRTYANEHDMGGMQITDDAAFTLGMLAYQDGLIAEQRAAAGGIEDRTVEMDGMGYTWNPDEGIKLLWAEEATVTGLHQLSAGDILEQANETIDNILYKKYLEEAVTEEDYAFLDQFGMNDIAEYLKGVETVEYGDLSESTRDQIKEVVIQNGYYAYFDFTPDELDFLKTATVDMIDARIAEESAKAEPDVQMLDALSLYRYYKNDLGIEVTGNYEADRTAAKKVFADKLCEMTGLDSFDDVLLSNAGANGLSPESGPRYMAQAPEMWQEINRILNEAPPELFINTAEETQTTYETGAFIGGLRNGISLGLAALQKESVIDPEEMKQQALAGTPVGGTEFYRNGRFYIPGIAEEDAIFAQYNKWAYMIGNIAGALPMTIATGGLAGSIAQGFNLSKVAVNAISGFVPMAIRGGASAAAAGGDAGDIIFNAAMEGAFAAVSFGTLGTAAGTAVGNLLSKAPALLQMTLSTLASATVTAIADTGLNILSDVVMGRDIDWGQTFANMGVDFLFSLFLNGRSGDNAYVDPATGKNIDIPAGKTLADIDPEAARFYEALGETKMTGELHTSIGDMYTQYLDIPESVVSRSDFKGLETAYRNYEANATVRNAAAFLDEAGRVHALVGEGGYRIDNPYSRVNAAMAADFTARQGGTAGTNIEHIDRLTGIEDNNSVSIGTRKKNVVQVPYGDQYTKGINGRRELKANVTFATSDGYRYTTDEFGRIDNVEGRLIEGLAERNEYAQGVVGREDRLPTDEGGHLIARVFRGSGDIDNLVPMDATLNRSDWKAMENAWRRVLNEDGEVRVKIQPIYEGASMRPVSFEVRYSINGDWDLKIFTN